MIPLGERDSLLTVGSLLAYAVDGSSFRRYREGFFADGLPELGMNPLPLGRIETAAGRSIALSPLSVMPPKS